MAPSVKGLIVVACSFVAFAAHADDPAAAAARAYDQGAKALREHDDAGAARAFAEADRIAPHPTTLAEALRAALDADSFDLARELVARAESRDTTPELARLVAEAKRVLPAPVVAKPTTGSLVLEAPAECTFSGAQRTLTLPPGLRTVGVHCPDATSDATTDVAAGLSRTLHVDYRPRRGPPLFVPVTLLGASFVTLGFGILRGAYAGDRAADLTAAKCATAGSDACRENASNGHAAQVQANVGFVVAGVLGAAAVGTWVWHRRASVSFGASAQRASLQLSVPWN